MCRKLNAYEAELTVTHVNGEEIVFIYGLADTDSSEFDRTATVVEAVIDESLSVGPLQRMYKGCEVNRFRHGSVIVIFDIYLTRESIPEDRITTAFTQALRGNMLGTNQTLTVIPSSFQVQEKVESAEDPWYNHPFYIALLCAGGVAAVAVCAISVYCCKFRKTGRNKPVSVYNTAESTPDLRGNSPGPIELNFVVTNTSDRPMDRSFAPLVKME
ncbi:PREDICTED: uncharacterized protein LOC109476734 [Branchiostoma belcheri]|uniref:Uncharacterized protein LOC109476734 n=1 Tax=Branchiostoma belcheri TaxID=7741 RepID=A0A6P4Z9F4_BRABE|nr:PREDICTED: uncharacterized protein LOC109476734 [Branchiostoma belcheri]